MILKYLFFFFFSHMQNYIAEPASKCRLELNNKDECPFIWNSSQTTWKAIHIPADSMTVGYEQLGSLVVIGLELI